MVSGYANLKLAAKLGKESSDELKNSLTQKQ
jgi:hypothetical protein